METNLYASLRRRLGSEVNAAAKGTGASVESILAGIAGENRARALLERMFRFQPRGEDRALPVVLLSGPGMGQFPLLQRRARVPP